VLKPKILQLVNLFQVTII